MVNIEKELKYVVDLIPDNYNQKQYIEQYYFNPTHVFDVINKYFSINDFSLISTYRVRRIIEDSKEIFVLTLKTKGSIEKMEYETLIGEDEFKNIVSQPIDSLIIKNRYKININNYCYEFDEYLNLNQSLITCEVEYLSEMEEVKKIVETEFERMNIKYVDVSFDYRYKNSNLIKYFGR